MTKHLPLLRIVFSFLLCIAFFGILVPRSGGHRAIGAIVFGSFGPATLLLSTPAGLIIVSSFSPASVYKRVGFWLAWILFAALVMVGSIISVDWITNVSSIPFWVSSTISIIIRLREKDGT